MSKPVFTWRPAPGASSTCKPNVTKTQFGDGYELRVAIGINFKPKTWKLKFTFPVSGDVLSFLEDRGGVESFLWTDPRGVPGTYVCREWDDTDVAPGIFEVTCSFEQVFEV